MRVKDYYKILDLPATATQQDIKKAYRKLAMKYHPDKNAGNDVAEAQFLEIQEAYQVLSDPDSRSRYSQQRWYRQGSRHRSYTETLTPQMILQKSRQLNRYLSSLDSARIDQQALHQYLLFLLREKAVDLLIKSDDQTTNDRIISELLRAAKPLSFRHMEKISETLVNLAGGDNKLIGIIHDDLQQRKFISYWHRYQGLIILLLTLALCWFIYVVSQ